MHQISKQKGFTVTKINWVFRETFSDTEKVT